MLTLLLLSCAAPPTLCEQACDVLYAACGPQTQSHYPEEIANSGLLYDQCYAECGAATEQHQDEWSACVLGTEAAGYDEPDGEACAVTFNECGLTPCANGERFLWATPHYDWTCEP